MSTRGQARSALFDSDDLLAVALEAVVLGVLGVFRALWAALVMAVRFPAAAVPLLLVVAAGVLLGSKGVALVLVMLAALLGAWRLKAPSSFSRHVSDRSAFMVRNAIYRLRWTGVARRTDLVAHDGRLGRGRDPELVALLRVRPTTAGSDRLLLRLPTGLTPDDVAGKADAIAHAFRSEAARIHPDRPGRVWLELRRADQLAAPILPLPQSDKLDLAALPVGHAEDGSTWHLRLAGTHLLIAGATGAGKSSVLWSMLRALTRGIRQGLVEVWAVDPKGGMELRPGRALFARFEDSTPEDMCVVLEDLVVLKDSRAKQLAESGQRSHVAGAGSPHIIALLDELATLTAFADRAVTRRIDTALGLLLTQGRACGITVVAAVQDPGKDIVGWRDLFPTRVAMRLDNPLQVAMVLGDGAREMGAKADEISELTPGVAFVRVEGTRQIKRVRAAYVNDNAIAELAAQISVSDEQNQREEVQ
ncbi:FtsK/SpoIIIE domain-containing protein [Intrasporangium calvum]|uniref:Cell division protein FtsK/SpoIIIE n=1 Tax=Intrasporangium calvum (strain ATCC 23552 / DSM 43043 / JCM 3097 / NBRC 12989 / NCIMB 10167 / NRRL B-3866 / 7 KIP) TaxID=710696 RepID=E6SDX6_INTC7|nr:FtsK/SpoIIIE domain-containing protein [Intrasporangium calvum]ADU46579.1 cell division protein FtsK/SpoIIIE [Intrasporangium calvum DSM 43043]